MPPPATVIVAKRKKVIQAATRLFFEQGYDAMTVDALVAEVGGSKGYIYNNFGGKKELFEAIVENACSEILEPLSHTDVAGMSLDKGLKVLAEKFLKVSLAEKSIALHRLIVAERLRFPHLGEIFLQAGPEKSYQKVAAFLRTHQEKGHLRPGDPYDLAVQFLGLVNAGFLLRMLSAGEPLPAKKMLTARVKSAVDVFTNGAIKKT
ncbi:TetR/AcrR family transcriptional regulator [Eoetvoesiella caeni]